MFWGDQMHRLGWILFALTLFVAVVPDSMATYLLRSPEPNPGTPAETAQLDARWWGLVSPDIPTTCETNAIDEVQFRRTFVQSLIGTFTLGILVPAEVQWRCAKPNPGTGEVT